jgi:sugar (pentulose or hexulose) kinase
LGRGQLARLAAAKDWLHWWLTHRLVTDPSTAAGYGCLHLRRGDWDSGILAAAFGDTGPALPEVQPAATITELSGKAAAELALPAGLPVCLGAADSVLAARGLGVTLPGAVAYIAGTSTVILAVSFRAALDPRHRYLLTPMDGEAPYGLEADLVSTGSAVRWLADTLGLGEQAEQQVWALAEGSAPGARGLVFLPYLGPGEQGTLWNPRLRGAITGLTLAHTRADLARALLEGIVLESSRCLSVLAEAGASEGEIVMTGGPARAAVFRRALADATGRPVHACAETAGPASAWGAAALAFQAVGASAPPPPAPSGITNPDPGAEHIWAALWERHEHARRTAGTLPPGPRG